MSPIQINAIGMAWVGVWGFLFFVYPQFACRLFRVRNPTPARLKMVRIIGAIELALVVSGLVLTAIFGLELSTQPDFLPTNAKNPPASLYSRETHSASR